jgi:hypothetical protein
MYKLYFILLSTRKSKGVLILNNSPTRKTKNRGCAVSARGYFLLKEETGR